MAIELLYICLDQLIYTLFSTRVSLWERALETMSVQFGWCSANIFLGHIHWYECFGVAQISRPALLC